LPGLSSLYIREESPGNNGLTCRLLKTGAVYNIYGNRQCHRNHVAGISGDSEIVR